MNMDKGGQNSSVPPSTRPDSPQGLGMQPSAGSITELEAERQWLVCALENERKRTAELKAENARLRELACWQEDDAEPVDRQFLLSVGFAYESFGRNDGVYQRTVNDCRILVFPEVGDGHTELQTPSGSVVLISKSSSKGSVRRLIAALEGK